jgi:site-specific DNA recombinase
LPVVSPFADWNEPRRFARIKANLDQAMGVLSKMDKLYREGDVKKKRPIVGSIYPGKLIFEGIQY